MLFASANLKTCHHSILQTCSFNSEIVFPQPCLIPTLKANHPASNLTLRNRITLEALCSRVTNNDSTDSSTDYDYELLCKCSWYVVVGWTFIKILASWMHFITRTNLLILFVSLMSTMRRRDICKQNITTNKHYQNSFLSPLFSMFLAATAALEVQMLVCVSVCHTCYNCF